MRVRLPYSAHPRGAVVDTGRPRRAAVSLGERAARPNAINTPVNAPNTGRGLPNWFEQLPTAAAAASLSDSGVAIDKNFRNPYTER